MQAQPADEIAIRERAYYLWEQEGRPHGRDTEFWMRAVVAVTEQSQMDTLTAQHPKSAREPKAAASRSKAIPAKSSPSKVKAKSKK